MKELLLETPVGQLVIERPARAAVFERLGIDYCCGGKSRLVDACAGRGLDPDAVLRALTAPDGIVTPRSEADGAGVEWAPEDGTDWSAASMSALVDHIVEAHHAYLREALPSLSQRMAKVVHAHGERRPELATFQQVFETFRAELEAHMLKEERVLFPLCRALETARELPEFHCGSVRNPILVMTLEHEDAGEALRAMRELTDQFTPPPNACNTYRALLDGLAELERDLHRHVHEENNILFPRAAAAEARLSPPE
jgi:regulator of cell morphogenesis and NO signaling